MPNKKAEQQTYKKKAAHYSDNLSVHGHVVSLVLTKTSMSFNEQKRAYV